MYIVLIVLLIALLLGALPGWGYHQYGMYPSSIVGVLLVVLVVFLLLGHLR